MDPQIELHEADAFADFFAAAPIDVQSRYGIDQFSVGAARGVLTPGFEIAYLRPNWLCTF